MIKTALATVGGLTLLAGAAFSTYSIADSGQQRTFDSDRMISHLSERLNLDETQQAAVLGILEQSMPIIHAAREDMRSGRMSLIELDPGSVAYNAQVAALAESAAQHARTIVTQLGQVRVDVSAVLTEEQLTEFDQWLNKPKRRGRKQKRGDSGE